MARNCDKQVNVEGNSATVEREEPWDVEANVAQVEEVAALIATQENRRNRLEDWIVDSGCSNHLTGEKERLKNPIKYGGSRVIVIADNSKHSIANIGDVAFSKNNSKKEMLLKDVYHVPGMKKNLISVPQMTSEGYYVLFGPEDVKVFEEFETKSTPVLQGPKTDTVYVLDVETAYVKKAKGKPSADLWHKRLGHVGLDTLGRMVKQKLVDGLPDLEVNKDGVCSGCQYGKASQLPFKPSTHKSTTALELVHSDVFGPVKQPSMQGFRYMIAFIDDFSRFTWIYFMKEKSEALCKFKEFEIDAELMTRCTVRCLRSDNGGEYVSAEFNSYLRQRRIRRQLTCPNTPQQNGISERKNRHLGEVTKSLVHDKNMPSRFWAEAMRAACFVINRLPSQSLEYSSPLEKLTKVKPNVSYLRVFGSVCYVFVPSHLRHKMEKKAIRCVFVGYDSQRKGWRCCDPSNGKVYVSRNVIFDEQSSWWSSENHTLPDSHQLQEDLENSQVTLGLSDDELYIEGDDVDQNQEVQEGTNDEHNDQLNSGLRRSQRVRKPNTRYANVAISEDVLAEPSSYDEACLKREWCQAMQEEMEAMYRNETWDLVSKPHDVKTVSCKWVYKLKQKADGSVERFKARLVARGFSQEYGVNYEETFGPVAKLTTLRVLLAMAMSKGWVLEQMDVNNTFLYGELDHVIYMDQPRGFESQEHPEYVCKLRKAIYGLKQSPRAWFGKIAEFLELNGFKLTHADSSLYVKKLGDQVVVVLVYVDDLIITGDVQEEIAQLKENLCVRFRMKDLGRLVRFLGLELSYNKEGVVLHQEKYASDLLHKFGMFSCKAAVTPMDAGVRLYTTVGRQIEDPSEYRRLVGSLIYLTLTRPDLSFAVGVLSRFMQDPRKPHLIAIRRVLRYMKGTMSKGILFKRECNPKLIGYCDADYAGDLNQRRSTTGYVFLFGSSPVCWCSKRQPTVSLSTTEAEYRAAAMAAQECTWLVQLLTDLNQVVDYKVRLWCDNMSAIKLAENPVFHARTKHIEVDYHFYTGEGSKR
ncbi:putative RNA-directed DNA polymerase [Helianthus annuus]|nr:putative RNA-directed DNA polymerase [Helianthus annuus]KAJ0656632.1 putative RNA-directed DNA polymerase [Helianthus annuus]KAJ0660233.1 putative RNA-directed DNA polymerase [Helianthus annuus]KAJ0840739.1 putative RNA-directed DNA polymerase [Helianthus annuus]